MDDEMRILNEALVIKERLRVLAELQATYWDELLARGFEASIAEQLMLEWSRHAYGMTFRAMPEPNLDSELDELLGPPASSVAPAVGAQPPGPMGDPSSVPPGEPWLQLVDDVDAGEDAAADDDQRAA